ncbi:MAG: NAD(P)H-dependent oxidoreductase subunit E, partial [Patescibacteria group bacterium]|nr:NAD(P)H-dependent oxidoreductase subunit E [Patescibacteria group bacterium]
MDNAKRIADVEALGQLRDSLNAQQANRPSDGRKVVRLCMGASCIASGAERVREALKQELASHELAQKVDIVETGCMGPCSGGPVLVIDDVFYEQVHPEDAADLVVEHLGKGKMVDRLTHRRPDGRHVPRAADMDFFKRQTKIVLRNCGQIDPRRIDDYIARDGYQALARVLAGDLGEQVLTELKASGLRGRGGAGFPTWRKWKFTREAAADAKFVVCNADEGDPGAFMDRSVLEGDPHSIIEGMAIAA